MISKRYLAIKALNQSLEWLDDWRDYATKIELKKINSMKRGLVYALEVVKVNYKKVGEE